MRSLRWLAGWCFALAISAQTGFFPLKDVRQGMRGTGRTVFAGSRIDEFRVEILGVLENVGPQQSIILGRLSGGPLETAGVLQGMSGSPVYIGGRLVGAVALAFPFSKEPIAGIRPIEEMLRAAESPATARPPARVSPFDRKLTGALASPQAIAGGDTRLVEIATPVSFSGFTQGALEQFAPELRALGLEPCQGTGGAGNAAPRMGTLPSLQPGSMISVQLVTGDMNVGADGTVTYVDGKRIYAFGHRFLAVGPAEFPFARAEVLTLLPTLSSSFKISTSREWLGTITEDRGTAIAGELGRHAAVVPVAIAVNRRAAGRSVPRASYKLEMVHDRYITPLLLQIALFSAIDATERAVGASSLAIRGEIRFGDGVAPIRLNNMFAGDWNVPVQASLAAAVPLAYAMQSGFGSLRLKSVQLVVESFTEKRQLQIGQVWASRSSVRPGETVDLSVALTGDDGKETTRRASYRVPEGAETGPLYFTVADGNTTNLGEYQRFAGQLPRSVPQLIALLNDLRGNTKAYVRVWRAEAGYYVQGGDLPAPPPSVSMILLRTPSFLGGAVGARNSKVAELEIPFEDAAVYGSKTLQVEVKE